MRSLLAIPILLLASSCMSTTARLAQLSDEWNSSMAEYAQEQAAQREAFEQSVAERQTEYEIEVSQLRQKTDEAISEAATEDEVRSLEMGFRELVADLTNRLRAENKEALNELKDTEIASVKELVEEGGDAFEQFKDGVTEDFENLKENGKEVTVSAARTAGSALGFGPLVDLVIAITTGAGAGAVGLNQYRNKKRVTQGPDYVPGYNASKRPGEGEA